MAKSKRLTKQQREKIQKAELRKRVADIACGAAGYDFDSPDEFATAEFLEKFVCALQALFGAESNEYLWKPHCLAYWDTIDTATDALWEHNIRP